MMPRGVGSISTPEDFPSAIFKISLFRVHIVISSKSHFSNKKKNVYKSRDLLYHQKMAYPRTDAQRPTYWKVFHYYSKRFHESRVITFSVGETSTKQKKNQGEPNSRVQLFLFLQKIDLVYFENRDLF